jgi:hypothetical protein
MKRLVYISILLFSTLSVLGQNQDSLAAENTLQELLTICNSVVNEGESSSGNVFERLSPYILYTGNDATRKHKEVCDYNKPEDRKLVDNVGEKLSIWLEAISEFKVVKYQLQMKGNSEWHYLTLSFENKEPDERKVFVFIKIKGRFLLESIE